MNAEEDLSIYNGDGTDLRKAQLRMVEMLAEIDHICKKHNIPYWLDFGTLLGAVRHQGFIPWDDDLDISTMKKYSKKLDRILSEELPDRYFVYSHDINKKCTLEGFSRVVDKKSTIYKLNGNNKQIFTNKNELINNGLNIDIFRIEKGGRGFKLWLNRYHGRALRRIKKNIYDGWLNLLLAYMIIPLTFTIRELYRLWFRCVPTNGYIYDLPNNVAPQVCSQRFIDDIFPLQSITFEGKKFPCPNNTDRCLKETYGDYMTIPPKEKRIVHYYKIEISDR